ncbi:Maneal [Symbiodinium microadriaticum]|nr:Maneal [Symbiodinium microadriaticum]
MPTCTRADGSVPAVHAAFYLWYGTPEVDGKWLHWDHKVLPHWDKEVDAKYDKFNWSPPDEPHATFYPERGPYSSSDESILLSQFEDLAKAGVDSAMCSWWGRKDWAGKRDDADSGANTDELIPSVLEAAVQAGVFVSFHIEPYGGRSPQTFLDDLAYIVREYGHHPAIWREGPKKLPLFWLYDVSAQHSMQDIAAWKEALDSVRGTELDGVFLCTPAAFGLLAKPLLPPGLMPFRLQGPWRMRRRSASRGGLRPTSAPRLAKSFEPGGGDATVKGHPNPFKAEHAQFLQERRQKSPKPGARKGALTGGTAAEVKKLRQRQREHLVLQNLERLEDKHTAARAVQALEEVIGTSTSVEELNRFLRLGFDSKRPLVTPKARQEQLLLLRSIVRQFHSLGGDDTSAATAALKERVMPLLVDALRSPDLQEAVVSTVHDILACHVPEESPDAAKHGFVQAGRIILKALLDPLALGMGWDAAVKRRCVMTLAAITKELLQRAKHCQPQEVDGASLEADPDPEVQALLETYARLLVHSLEVSSELHEGLLQCLVQLANDEAGRAGLLPRARELAELCASHLLQTPSAQPLYVRQAKAELATSESPQRTHRARELTRELAMVCCLLLQRLAQELLVEAGAAEGEEAAKETSEEPSLEPLREQVLTSLHRDNLNLHRLTRGHEPLRRAIAAARQAWEAEVGAEVARPPPKPRHRGMKSALAMRELLEEQEQKKRPGRSQPRKPAKDADGAVRKDAQAPAEPLEPPEPPEPGPGRPGRPDGTASVASDGACSTGVADGVAAGEEQDYDVASYCSHVSEASFWLACGRPQQLLRSKAGCHQERAVRRTMATTRYADVESQLQGVSAQQVRLGFVRKVYGIVCAQVMFTALFGALCCWGPLNAPILRLATSSPRLLQWGTLIASLVALAMCQLGKDRYPINMLGLCFLTAVMSLDVGVVCAMVAAIGLGELVVQAAVITSLLTLGLTLYTFKSKRDFSFLGAALWPLLFGLVVFSLLSVFFPSLQMGWTGLLFSFAGAGIFCAYIVFDTWRILNQMNCDDYVQDTASAAALSYRRGYNYSFVFIAQTAAAKLQADDASLTARGGCEAGPDQMEVEAAAVRRVEVQTTAAGPVPRMPQRSGAGRMSPPKASKSKDPPREAKKDAPVKTAKDAATEVTPDALMAEPGFTPEVCPRSHSLGHEDCPVLAGVFDYLAAGRVELAMQCIFSLGNEQTLRAVLQRLDSDAVWPELPKPEAQHLVPTPSWPHGENLLPAEDLKFPGMVEFRAPGRSGVQELLSLQGALFSASAATTLASARVFMMFMSFQQQHRCLWIGNGGGREDIRFVEDGGFDGAYTYFAAEGFTPGSNTKSWKDTAARLKKLGKLFVPSVGPGYDDTRVRPWNSHNIRERKGGEYYSRMWSAAVGSRPYAVSVTSYNEWGEGTQIEPAKRHRSWKGAKYGSYEPKPSTFYLTETKRWSDQFKAAL